MEDMDNASLKQLTLAAAHEWKEINLNSQPESS